MDTISSLKVVIIRPSNYDDDGFIVRYFKGVFPSNTLACMRSLTLEFAERWKRDLDIDITVDIIDELVEKIPFKKLARMNRDSTKVVVAIAGVQTNQFARASDIAKKLTGLGVKTLIGGFHVSGVIAMFKEPSPELQELIDCGVTLVQGEAEHVWESILFDVVHGKEQLLYRMEEYPDISDAPVPQADPASMKKNAVSCMGTIDCSRGCPFNCSFCTIINVQGKNMRQRSAEAVLKSIRDAYDRGITQYFFTDDNFSRNKNWGEIFEGLARMREDEDIKVGFIMQVDTACDKIEGFIEKASKAGCSTVFIGMESLNPDNLKAVGKTQNKVDNYASFIAAWHKAGVMCHVGYIIGFQYDTPDSVRHDIDRLKNEIRPDLASFFILTPLPGSRDHYDLVQSGANIDSDLNRYDSFHTVADHPLMSRDELYQTYENAWKSFYDFENMKNTLARARKNNYWTTISFCLMWYKNSMLEPRHPMVTGFVRRKARTEVRPGTPVMSRPAFALMRIRELFGGFRRRIGLFYELQELWWLTRRSDERSFRLVTDFTAVLNDAKVRITAFDFNSSYAKWCEEMNAIRISLIQKTSSYYNSSDLRGMSRRRLNKLIDEMNTTLEKVNIGEYYNRSVTTLTSYLSKNTRIAEESILKRVRQRRSMTRLWSITWERLKRGRILSVGFSIPRLAVSAIRDIRMSLFFTYHFFFHKS